MPEEVQMKPEDKAWIEEMKAAGNNIWWCGNCRDLRAIPEKHPTINVPKKWNCKGCGRFLKKIEEVLTIGE